MSAAVCEAPDLPWGQTMVRLSAEDALVVPDNCGQPAPHSIDRSPIFPPMPLCEMHYAQRRAMRIRAAAMDLWNELENLRSTWEGTERGVFIGHYIEAFEKEAGL